MVEIFGYLKYAFKVFVPLSFLSSLYLCKRIMKHPKEKPGVDNKQLLEFQTFLDPRRRGFMTREWNYSLISYLTSPRLDGPQRPDSHSCNRKKKDKEKAKVLKHELPFSSLLDFLTTYFSKKFVIWSALFPTLDESDYNTMGLTTACSTTVRKSC